MADLATTYLGLSLRNPLLASASPLTGDIAALRALEDHGVAAVVLPSLFEEDISRDQRELESLLDAGEGLAEVCGGFFPTVHADQGVVERYLALIADARSAVDIPVIASLNGATDAGWIELARLLEQAGASAVELNLYHLPLNLTQSAVAVERDARAMVGRVRDAIDVPLAVKLNPYYSAFGEMATTLEAAGADALVLFNRLYHPDIDPLRLCEIHDVELSRRYEMRLPMMWLAALRGRVSVSLAGSTGVETGDDLVRYLLVGADAVMSTSALLRHGVAYAACLLGTLTEWLDSRGFTDVDDIRGLLAQPDDNEINARERAAYRCELHRYQDSR